MTTYFTGQIILFSSFTLSRAVVLAYKNTINSLLFILWGNLDGILPKTKNAASVSNFEVRFMVFHLQKKEIVTLRQLVLKLYQHFTILIFF